ncbi:hypothetical protein [Nocardia sp. X0981]
MSNGTRPELWWASTLPPSTKYCLSYHHERAEPGHFRAVVDTVVATTSVDANVVIDPATFDTTMNPVVTIQAAGVTPIQRKVMFLDGWATARPAAAVECRRFQTRILLDSRYPVTNYGFADRWSLRHMAAPSMPSSHELLK